MTLARYFADMSKSEFETTAAGFILSSLDAAIASHNRVSLFLSGGGTPGPIYEKLSKTDFSWNKTNIGLVDERWVPETDQGSNAALIRRTFIREAAHSAKFLPMKTDHKTAELGQVDAEKRYEMLFNCPAIAIIGMGLDGHVCSWFPNALGLDKAIDSKNPRLIQAISAKPSTVTGPYLNRMSLTLTALRKCSQILLLISGEEKKKILEMALDSKSTNLPIFHLLGHFSSRKSNTLTILHKA